MAQRGLIDRDFIVNTMTFDDPWCASHGAKESSDNLGAGILYYAIAYATGAQTCVCLGSGGGYVPRLMRQAQRDRGLEESRTFLVDGSPHVPAEKKFWGTPCWIPVDSTFRKNYPEIEIILKLTETAFHEDFTPRGVAIDYLHIDADHHYEGVKLDWDLFHTLVKPGGIITLHDTVNHREPCGVPRLVREIQESGEYAVINFPIKYGTAVVQKIATG